MPNIKMWDGKLGTWSSKC